MLIKVRHSHLMKVFKRSCWGENVQESNHLKESNIIDFEYEANEQLHGLVYVHLWDSRSRASCV